MSRSEKVKPKTPSTVARNLAVTQGVAIDKALLLEGRPTEITGDMDMTGLLERMAKAIKLPAPHYDSTAEELNPGE